MIKEKNERKQCFREDGILDYEPEVGQRWRSRKKLSQFLCRACSYLSVYIILNTLAKGGCCLPPAKLNKRQLSLGHTIRQWWMWSYSKSVLAILGVSEKAYLHILYLNFMSTPKEKFNSLPKVSWKISNRILNSEEPNICGCSYSWTTRKFHFYPALHSSQHNFHCWMVAELVLPWVFLYGYFRKHM